MDLALHDHGVEDALSAFLQQNVPDQLRGRVLSIYSLCWNLMPLGGLLAGALAAAASALLLLTSRRLRALGGPGAGAIPGR